MNHDLPASKECHYTCNDQDSCGNLTCCGDRTKVVNHRNKSQLMASILEGDYQMDDVLSERVSTV